MKAPTMKQLRSMRCARCGRRYRGQADWNVTVQGGEIVGILCSQDQTAEETMEAAVREATMTYFETPDGELKALPTPVFEVRRRGGETR